MKNKILFLSVVLLFTASLLAGCADPKAAEGESAVQGATEPNIEPAPQEQTNAENELVMLPGEVAESYVYIDYASDDFGGGDVFFISENEKIATASFDYVWDNGVIYYKVTAVGVGETYICAVLPSGEMLTPRCKVTVNGGDEPETEAPAETVPAVSVTETSTDTVGETVDETVTETVAETVDETPAETEALYFEKIETETETDDVETEAGEQRLVYDEETETIYELPPQPVPEVEVTGMRDECEVN